MLRRREKQKASGSKRKRVRSQPTKESTLEEAVFGHKLASSAPVLGEREAAGSDGELEAASDAEAPVDTTLRQAPAWVDEDDGRINVDVVAEPRLRKLRATEEEEELDGGEFTQRLRQQFEKVHKRPGWADVLEQREPTAAEQLLMSSAKLVGGKSKFIPRSVLEVTRAKDANAAACSKAVVQAVQFHPTAPAVLTAGLDKTVRLFQVDGKNNTLMQSTFIRDLPMFSASFTHGGDEIVMSGRRKFFYVFDLQTGKVRKVPCIHGRDDRSLEKFWVSPDDQLLVFGGKDGTLILVSNKTKQWIANLTVGGVVRNVCFSGDSKYMYTSGEDGRVFVWDMGTRDCIHMFEDEGTLRSTALAASPDGSFVACASDMGVVNLYNASTVRSEARPKPLRALLNLTTMVDNLKFNHDGQVLVMSSRMKKDALRVVHTASQTVFNNWPTAETPLGYVHSLDISPTSGYLALGNAAGKVPLYRLKHFDRM